MFETSMTVVGNVITDPIVRRTATGDVCSFRMASNSRRRNPDGDGWVDDKTLYLTVSCWRRLSSGVAASVEKGHVVIASGNVHTSEYVNRDGERRATLEMNAAHVGHDLVRSIVKVCGFPMDGALVGSSDENSDAVEEVGAAGTTAEDAVAGLPPVRVTDVDEEIADPVPSMEPAL